MGESETTMAKHTPGDWFWNKESGQVLAPDPRGGFHEIASISSDDRFNAPPRPECAANGKLLAAAKELYEACRKANSCASLPDAVKELVRAALAKADPRP